MRRSKDVMPLGIYQASLLLGKTTPKQEHDTGMVFGDRLDDRIREELPALPLVRASGPCTDSKGRIQQQHALLRPWLKVPGRGLGHP